MKQKCYKIEKTAGSRAQTPKFKYSPYLPELHCGEKKGKVGLC